MPDRIPCKSAASVIFILWLAALGGCQSSEAEPSAAPGSAPTSVAASGPSGSPSASQRSADQPLDLLTVIDPARDQVQGDFRLADKTLVVPSLQPSMLELPVEPPEAYELTMTVRRTSGNGSLNVGLTVEGNQTTLVLDGWNVPCSGLSLVNGQTGDANATTYRQPVFQNDKQIKLLCKVHPGEIRVDVDGKRIIDWRGTSSQLSLSPRTPTRNATRLTLGGWDAAFSISECSIKSLSGEPIVTTVSQPAAFAGTAPSPTQPTADDGWATLDSVGDSFVMRFPQFPQRSRIDGGNFYSVKTNTGEYSIAIFQALRGNQDAAEFAEAFIQELLSSGEKVQRTRPLKIAGAEYGKEIVAIDDENDLVVFRFYLTRENLYQLMYIGPPDRDGSVETLRFLDSFQIKR